MRTHRRLLATPLALLLAATLLAGCAEKREWVRAVQVSRQDELIGGPSAKGKIGDFLIENDQVRAVVAGNGPTWAAGVFGGGLVDLDRARWEASERNGNGFDSFSETFPLANLLVANPSDGGWQLAFGDEGFKVTQTVSAITLVKDGSDGEAIIRVEGHSGYMFDVLKYLNRDFLESFLAKGFAGMTFKQLVGIAKSVLKVDLLGLLNRLQISFDFTTDYVLHGGEQYLTIRTTLRLSPPSEKALNGCPPVPCDKTCEHGYALEEVQLELPALEGGKGPKLCPLCECAEARPDMPTFNESRDFFKILLGSSTDWADPEWKGGVVAGDFLFFGGNCDIFAPELGFDYDRKIFTNMWQGVGTMGSPFALEYVSGVGENVSYTWTARNNHVREGFDCPSYRLVVTDFPRDDPAREDALAVALADEGIGLADGVAKNAARVAVVDHTPIQLGYVVPIDPATDPGADAPLAERQAAFDAWIASVMASPEVKAYQQLLGPDVTLTLRPEHACLESKVLVPLFTTSATAILSHFSEGDRLQKTEGGTYIDKVRSYTFERYLIVGDGDVGSTLGSVYALRGTPHGFLQGVVLEEDSGAPVTHADVFVLGDPRANPATDPVPATFADYLALAEKKWGHAGFLSQMQTDVGTDPVHDGDFRAPMRPGSYLVLAHLREYGTSAIVPVTVTADRTEVVNFVLPAPGAIEFQVTDEGGQRGPARLSFIALDAAGLHAGWEGRAEPYLGDAQLDHGILKLEHSADGHGTVALPAGRYDVLISRGFEYASRTVAGVVVKPGQTALVQTSLPRELDTTGWLGADFHIHQFPSSDAGLELDTRLKAGAAEGLEFMSSSDHDHLMDYEPRIRELGLEAFLKTQVGVEMSPLEWGHYNGFPLAYDDTDGNVHNPPQWQGGTLDTAFAELRKRAANPDDFVLEANHPRDGTLGMFSQIGLKGYDLERKTPGMQMCNAVLESVPCDFDAIEIINGKHVEYLWTPTIGEMKVHNGCYREIVTARSATDFVLDASAPDTSVCGWLQVDPAGDCDTLEALTAASEADLSRLRARDHCRWHRAFKAEFDRCGDEGTSLVDCKRIALEAIKQLSVRYMLERTPEELASYRATTALTDLGCDFEKAFAGCTATAADDGTYAKGCGGEDCGCEACVCALHPECCLTAADGGTGWSPECATSCAGECRGCGNQPCTDRFQMLDDWFAFLNAGFEVAGVANSDSHNTLDEVGLPRTFVASSTDRPMAVSNHEIDRNLKKGRAVLSAGPFIEFQLLTGDASAGVGETLTVPAGQPLKARLRVQTASWFAIDRVELYRNGLQEAVFFLDPETTRDAQVEQIVDFDRVLDLERPAEDSWYIAMAYGIQTGSTLSPVYKRRPFGHILFTTVISLAAESLLAGYSDLLAKLPAGLLDVNSLLGSLEQPDSFPVIPYAVTNPIKADLDGGGYWAVNALDENNDQKADYPPFCSVPCEPAADDQGVYGASTCGVNQTCVPDERYAEGGLCKIPIPPECVGLQPVAGAPTESLSSALGSGVQSFETQMPGGILKTLFDPHRR